MSRARYSSNSGIFARRGDPWVSQKEGQRDYNRDLETEDAEYDFDRRFHSSGFSGKPKIAVEKPETVTAKAKPTEADFNRRKANVLAKMHKDMRANTRDCKEIASAGHTFKPCSGCKRSSCIIKGLCHVHSGGGR